MRDLDLFQQALGLGEPWLVVSSRFDASAKRLDLQIDFPRGARFPCPEGDHDDCPVHDTESKTWRHLDFFQHQAYLEARVPRIKCPEHGVRQVELAWARPGSGFTLLFEALVMALCKEMPVAAVANLVGAHDTRIWRVVHHYVDEARENLDLSDLTRAGIDETSFRRGQDYVSVFADLDKSRAVFVTEGRDKATVSRFAADLKDHGGDPDQITEICQDMSQSFLAGVLENLPEAEIIFDRYHVKAQLSKAVDEVRRLERKEEAVTLKGSRYLWLRNPANLSQAQRAELDLLLRKPLKTARAYQWAQRFDHVFELDRPDAEEFLRQWIQGARRSRLRPIKRFANMVEDHWTGILAWFDSKISNERASQCTSW